MSDKNEKRTDQAEMTEQLSLNDDRRVKVLSPGALVAKRFFRNRLAVVGLSMLIAMFLFSFLGGVISPYRQDEQFFTYTYMDQEYVGVVKNDELRYTVAEGQEFGSVLQAQLLLAINRQQDRRDASLSNWSLMWQGYMPESGLWQYNGTGAALWETLQE